MINQAASQIHVTCTNPSAHHGKVVVCGRLYKCALGRTGVRLRKREGDGATPIGAWTMQYVLYRRDRVARPASGLPVFPMSPEMGWCDDPLDRAYNNAVTLPYAASCENMWRDDELYDVVVILGHNDNPPVRGHGSAIFFHIARPGFTPTEGCVAVKLPDMFRILSICDTSTMLRVCQL